MTLGASSAAAVLGLSPFQSPWGVWADLTGVLPRDTTATGPMWLGTVLEDHIRDRWASEQGVTVRPGLKIDDAPVYPDDDIRWRHARPDGFIDLADGRTDLIEIKAVLFADEPAWGADGSDAFPGHYAAQIVAQADACHCAGMTVRGTHLVACDRARGEIRSYYVPHDVDRGAALRGALWHWYDRHIVHGEQPDPDASEACRLAAAALYGKPTKSYLEPTDADRAMVADLRELRAHGATVDEAIRVLENRLRLRIASDAGIAGLVSWTHRIRAGKPSAGQLKLWSDPNV